MILSKDQINRYLRHIIIPEISGPGQKKIIESKVFISASTVEEASSLIYYLAASGIGGIFCYFKNNQGFDNLFNKVKDLNGDVDIELIDFLQSNDGFLIKILISDYENLKDNLKNFSNIQSNFKFSPTIIATYSEWKGFLWSIDNKEDFDNLSLSFSPIGLPNLDCTVIEKEGNLLSNCLLGTLTAIECIKLCLNIGISLNKPLYFNLLSMEFYKSEDKNINRELTDFFKAAYLGKTFNKKKLSESKVLIVGTGGLGSPAAYALASLGIGTIGLVDYDEVEISNLNRQILHSSSRINMPKVESAKVFIKDLNPNVNVITYNTSLNISNALDIIKNYDVVVDAVDNFPARYLINDSCFFANKPLVDAAAVKFHGLILTILPKRGPCYRCTFPARIDKNPAMNCSEAGVLGPVPGVMGFLQAAEVVKLILDRGALLCNRIIYYDALDCDFDTINTNKSLNCDLCGKSPTITTPIEYKSACETSKKI